MRKVSSPSYSRRSPSGTPRCWSPLGRLGFLGILEQRRQIPGGGVMPGAQVPLADCSGGQSRCSVTRHHLLRSARRRFRAMLASAAAAAAVAGLALPRRARHAPVAGPRPPQGCGAPPAWVAVPLAAARAAAASIAQVVTAAPRSASGERGRAPRSRRRGPELLGRGVVPAGCRLPRQAPQRRRPGLPASTTKSDSRTWRGRGVHGPSRSAPQVGDRSLCLRAAIRRYSKPLADLVARDANEGDTRLLVTSIRTFHHWLRAQG